VKFYEVGKEGAPVVCFLGPGLAGWWSMAPLSSFFKDSYRCLLVDWSVPFRSIVDEARGLVAKKDELGAPFAAIAACGMGAQVAVEALCEDAQTARCAMLGDCLCKPERASGFNAWMDKVSWGRIKSERYARRYARDMGLNRAMVEPLMRHAAEVPATEAAAISRATGTWTIPSDVSCIRARTLVAQENLASVPWVESAKTLAAAIPGARLEMAKGLEQYDLYIRNCARGAELLGGLLAGIG
jgi:DNA-binding transcriptional regulator YdaS (Cro superfamily)